MATVANSDISRTILLLIMVLLIGFPVQAQNGGETYVRGELAEDTTWSGTVVIEETVTVPAGIILNIESGTIVSMMDSVSLIVYGQLIADGNEAEPIHFTHNADDMTWKQIMFIEAEDSRFKYCVFEYADSEGAHQDYYEPGPRNYHEAIIALATHLDFEGCTFQNLPDDGSRAEGDAMAIISDDPNHPGEASANIRNCRFLSIGQSVHTRFSFVLVEDCFFTGKRGDNDDVDLWGESVPSPMIRNNLFLNPEHDDMINPTKCSAVIVGNVIMGSDDHGIVLRDRSFPVVMNNLIVDCGSAGIAIENSCDALLVNNTIVDCGRGLRLFDLGRWGPPYRLNPGGGTATVVNCIIWDCPRPVTLTDSSNTEIEDTGSHITISYSVIPDGQDGVIISGTNSTLTWGQGNIDIDPQFADLANDDYHLKSQAGRFDPNSGEWVIDDVTSPCIDAGDPNTSPGNEPFPNGGIVNMGAYGGRGQASKSYFDESLVVDVNDSDNGGEKALEQGQILIVTLESNPTTGYSWEMVEDPNLILEQIGKAEFKPVEQSNPPIVGAGGWEVFRFEAISPGRQTLGLVYRRPWETGAEPAKTFSIDVIVN